MKVLLIALNAHYMHTSLALRQLSLCVPKSDDIGLSTMERHINLPFRRVLQDIAQTNADAFGFSCYIWNIDYVLKLCRALKKARPGCVIFLGGPEAACHAEGLLNGEAAVDYVLSGEGETVLPAFLKALRENRARFSPGVWSLTDEGVSYVPAPEPLPPECWPDV